MAVNRKSQLWMTLLFTALLLCALLFCAGAMAEEMPSAERTAETVETQDKTDGEAIPGEDDAQDSPAAEEEHAPVGEEAVPVEEESVPAEEEPLPVEEEPAPAEEEAVLTEEEFVPIEEEPLPVEEEPAPVEEESAPPQDKGYLVISDGTQVFYDSELTALYATVSENCTVYARIERELPGSWYVFRISFDTEASKTEENCLRGYVKIQGTPWAEIEPADGRILDDVRIPVIRKIFPAEKPMETEENEENIPIEEPNEPMEGESEETAVTELEIDENESSNAIDEKKGVSIPACAFAPHGYAMLVVDSELEASFCWNFN